MASATGASMNESGFSIYAASTSRPEETMMNARTCAGVTSPRGSARVFVRGFSESMSRSAQRLKPMAAERAPTIAAMIQITCSSDGSPSRARSAPVKAKGSAKMVCSNLIISRMILNLSNMEEILSNR